jgi:hypothetical protein
VSKFVKLQRVFRQQQDVEKQNNFDSLETHLDNALQANYEGFLLVGNQVIKNKVMGPEFRMQENLSKYCVHKLYQANLTG